MSDLRHDTSEAHHIPEIGGQGIAQGGHAAVDTLLVQPAVVRDHRLQARPRVDLLQTFLQGRLRDHRPESGLVDLPETGLGPAGS